MSQLQKPTSTAAVRKLCCQAAGSVIDSNRPIAPEHADTISVVTDNLNIVVETYGDAAHAIRRWFFQMREPGVRH